MSIRLVTHCYAGQCPHFAALLRYHLASLVLHRPVVPVVAEICCTEEDEATMAVLAEFQPRLGPRLAMRLLPPPRLWRRAIGRNLAALASTEELVWHCDADYVFGPGALDTLWRAWCLGYRDSRYAVLYPRTVQFSHSHAVGDGAAARAAAVALPQPEAGEYYTKRYTRAIGGAMIVRGTVARELGYLRGHQRWQRTERVPFPDFRDDVAARKAYLEAGPQRGIELPAIYRIRHSTSSYR